MTRWLVAQYTDDIITEKESSSRDMLNGRVLAGNLRLCNGTAVRCSVNCS